MVPTPDDSIKINVDANFFADDGLVIVWELCREAREVILSACDFLLVYLSVEEAELPACIVTLYIVVPLNKPIILKIDCKRINMWLMVCCTFLS